jgi:hypothetical protein
VTDGNALVPAGWHTWICAGCGGRKAGYNSEYCRDCYDAERSQRAEEKRLRKGPVPRPWTPEEDAYLRKHYESDYAYDIADALGRTYNAVLLRAAKYRLNSRQRAGFNSLVHDYFRDIDTPVKAYLIGLFLADGSISPANQFKLEIHAKDRCMAELAREEIAPNARIGKYQSDTGPMVRFMIQSADLAADLARHEVVHRKTLITTWPRLVPTHLENSVACGYFDGDGSLDIRHPYRASVVSGNTDFLTAYQDCVERHLGFRIGGPYRDTRHEHAWSIITTGVARVTALDAWLHRDVPGLARKRLR